MKKTVSLHIAALIGILILIGANSNHVLAQPDASFSVDNKVGCQVSVNFTPQSTGTNLNHDWDFGNGNSSQFETPVENYTIKGSYTVEHVVTNTNTGNQDTVIRQNLIEVYGEPNASFSVSPKSGCKPLSVNITNNTTTSSAPINSWTWDFGDGTVDTTENPSHTYTSSANYNISLSVKDTNGCQDGETSPNIDVSNAPTADFTAPNKKACEPPIDVNFTDTSQNPVGGSLNYLWDFGDGGTSTQQNPTHTYTSSGVYEVSLTVTDSSGCPNTKTKSNFVVVSKAEADFNFIPKDGCAPLEVNFQNTTSPKLPTTNYQWELGDGTITSKENPVHTYTSSGNYNIKLKAFSGNNCVDSNSTSLNVDPEPNFGFTSNQPFACKAPATVNFQSNGSNIVNYNWDFGNSKTSNSANPSNQYDLQGQYSVKLTIEDNNGCIDSLVKDSFVKISPPKPRFSIENKEGCDPLTSTFIDGSQSVDPIVNWSWDFDDGDTSNNPNPTHTYTDTGTYKPELTIETSQGCKNTVTEDQIRVGTRPNAEFNIPKKKGCLEAMNVGFQNLTNQNTPQADSFKWEFGDGRTSIKANPTHQYDAPPDTLDVTLRAFNNGCPDSIVKQDSIILIAPFAEFSYEKASCRQDSVYFKDLSVDADSLSWDFGDGTITSDTMPAHEYPNQGQYTVELEAFNDKTNCSHVEQKKLNVYQNFNPNPTKTISLNSCAPRQFDVLYTPNDSAKLLWDYGNGLIDSFNNQFIDRPVNKLISYDTPGTYTPKLQFESGNGCVIEETGPQITVDGTRPQFEVSPELGCIPLTVELIDSTQAPMAPIDSMYYTMSNGDTIKTNQADTVKYTYTSPAPNQNQGYPIKLHVVDSAGCTTTSIEHVKASKPIPEVAYSRDFFCDSVTYNFFAATADSNGLDPMSSYWEFGQNETFNKNLVSKTFSSDQNFNIKLVLTDAIGCKDSTNYNFTFDKKLPKAGFVSDTFQGDCPPLVTNFTDTTKPGYTGIKKWQWDFGDGSFSVKRNPEKVFTNPGDFDVKLTVTDSANCVDSFVAQDYILVDGPAGNYSFDTTGGCEPLDVNFSVSSSNAIEYQWSFGDGGSSNSQTPTYSYTRADTFKPTVALKDANGCENILGPIDSIMVKPSPQVEFAMSNPCFGYPTKFYDSTSTLKGQLTAWNWNFDGLGASNQQNPDFTFPSPDLYNINLEVDNSLGCSSQKSKEFDIGGLEVGFSALDSNICLGNPVDFIDETFADTTINSWKWNFGNGNSSSQPNPSVNYKQPGAYDVTLIVDDILGCSDTVTKPNYINVADTVPPPNPKVHRVTVQSDNSVRVDFEQFKGFGHKYYTIYRQNNGNYQQIEQINDLYDTSYVDSLTNPLIQPQCYKVTVTNSCDLTSQLDQARQHCTVELKAEVDTNQTNLNWTPYVGWDNVDRYNILRQKLDTPSSYFKIGEVPGDQTFYSDTDIVCYQRYTYKIQAIDQDPNSYTYSLSDSSGAKPIYKADFPPNNLIKATVVNDENILLEWEPPKQTEVNWYSIEKRAAGNQPNKSTSIVGEDKLRFLDESVIVDSNSYIYRVQPFDSCEVGGPFSNIGKTILLETEVTEDLRPRLKWTKYREWESGVDYYNIEIMQNDGSFEIIHQTDGPDQTTYTDTSTDLNALNQYCYRIVAQRNDGFGNNDNREVKSTSNEDCVTGISKLYVPNAFSPNDDGINDAFFAKGLYIQKFKIKIYDRWGSKVFESSDINEKWDGTFKEKRAPEDVYIYVIQAVGIDGETFNKTGKLLLLRK